MFLDGFEQVVVCFCVSVAILRVAWNLCGFECALVFFVFVCSLMFLDVC